jgi:hypothetical protein
MTGYVNENRGFISCQRYEGKVSRNDIKTSKDKENKKSFFKKPTKKIPIEKTTQRHHE